MALKRETQYLQFLLQKNDYYIRIGKRLEKGEQTGGESDHFIVPVRSLTAEADALKHFEVVELPQLIYSVPNHVFIAEEHKGDRGASRGTTRADT